MPFVVATHSGPFHADDVVAWALVRDHSGIEELELVRTRDAERIAEAQLVFDVGGIFDPERLRFDHHQRSYTGSLSSAGMVLAWLESSGRIGSDLAQRLREQLVDYVDQVDNGVRAPEPGVPCLAWAVSVAAGGATDLDALDVQFRAAAEMASLVIRGIAAGLVAEKGNEQLVLKAMGQASSAGSNLLELDAYVKWQPAYFRNGGATHLTEFAVFQGIDGTWRVVAIPPIEGTFGKKRPLPEAWAGLENEALAEVTGSADSVFCHKNRFIAVFRTRDGLMGALQRAGLLLA